MLRTVPSIQFMCQGEKKSEDGYWCMKCVDIPITDLQVTIVFENEKKKCLKRLNILTKFGTYKFGVRFQYYFLFLSFEEFRVYISSIALTGFLKKIKGNCSLGVYIKHKVLYQLKVI